MKNKKKKINKKLITTLKKNKKLIGAIGLGILLILIVVLLLTGKIIANKNNNNNKGNNQNINIKEPKKKEKVSIIDVDSKTRNIAVMVNNHPTARRYHTGLQDAHIIYEIIVEGGITRYLAIFKDADTAQVGSVRSARHYFLDYAMENDAIFVHHGKSPQAQNDMNAYGIQHIDADGRAFWREKGLGISSEHTSYASVVKLMDVATAKKFRTTTEQENLLDYSAKSIDLASKEGAIPAKYVNIVYSGSFKSQYNYDENSKLYLRSVNGKAHTDYKTKKQYTFKNIITYQVANSTIPGGGKGRQQLDNVGSGEGWYISEGYAVPITWEKPARDKQTIYKFKNGDKLKVNDGNTFIQIQPKNKTLEIN